MPVPRCPGITCRVSGWSVTKLVRSDREQPLDVPFAVTSVRAASPVHPGPRPLLRRLRPVSASRSLPGPGHTKGGTKSAGPAKVLQWVLLRFASPRHRTRHPSPCRGGARSPKFPLDRGGREYAPTCSEDISKKSFRPISALRLRLASSTHPSMPAGRTSAAP